MAALPARANDVAAMELRADEYASRQSKETNPGAAAPRRNQLRVRPAFFLARRNTRQEFPQGFRIPVPCPLLGSVRTC